MWSTLPPPFTIENLQLLFAHRNRVKGGRSQEYLVARLREPWV